MTAAWAASSSAPAGWQLVSRPAGSGRQRKGREVGCAGSGAERRRGNPMCVPAGLARGRGRRNGARGGEFRLAEAAGGCGRQPWADVQSQVCRSVALSSVAFESFYGLTMIITAAHECLSRARRCTEINPFGPPDSSEQAPLSHSLHR